MKRLVNRHSDLLHDLYRKQINMAIDDIGGYGRFDPTNNINITRADKSHMKKYFTEIHDVKNAHRTFYYKIKPHKLRVYVMKVFRGSSTWDKEYYYIARLGPFIFCIRYLSGGQYDNRSLRLADKAAKFMDAYNARFN